LSAWLFSAVRKLRVILEARHPLLLNDELQNIDGFSADAEE
jgi:cbb3-type cytochrome oxidase subunit 3